MRHAHLVVAQVAVATLHAIPLLAGERGLQRQHPLCSTSGIRLPSKGEHPGEIRDIRGARRHGLGVVAQVVIAIGKPQPGLIHRHDVHGRRFRILPHSHTDGSCDAEPREVRERGRELGRRLQPPNYLQLGRERRDTKPLDARRIHVARIQIANLVTLGIRRPAGGVQCRAGALVTHGLRRTRGVLEQGVETVAAAVAQFLESADAGGVAGDFGLLEPSTVHEAEEVVLWADRVIEVGGVDAAGECLRVRRACADGERNERNEGDDGETACREMRVLRHDGVRQ